MKTPVRKAGTNGGRWTFLTNHAHVLLCIARKPSLRIRDLAELVGITERTVQGIISDLEVDGYVTHVRHGRCNSYRVNPGQHMRHPVERHRRISTLMGLVNAGAGAGRGRTRNGTKRRRRNNNSGK